MNQVTQPLVQYMKLQCVKADFHSVEFSIWTGNPLFTFENVAFNLTRMLRVTNILLCQIQSAWKILLNEWKSAFKAQFTFHV